ncbi:MAG: 23S rRNA (adenine(2503)-C(2))-methyltransferase RlmN [Chloroflexi bacterium]|nr:23S rRNA (adenine(2503)-C(2))-methyltransferase RlmN [Chloroflexota bacterium]
MKEKINPPITDLSRDQLYQLVTELGEPSYRAKQLMDWVYSSFVTSFDEMGNITTSFREKLAGKVRLHGLAPVKEVKAADGTIKTLFILDDSKTIEATLMSYESFKSKSRYTVCVSTQVGCPIGCCFCATGQQGFERNLSSGEIIDQVLYFARYLRLQKAASITNIVFMGMGEPMLNYESLIQSVRMLTSQEGFGLGARNITVSTAGFIPEIKRLSKEGLQVGLAISLHASDDKLRDQLVPINKKYPLKRLLAVCEEYCEVTGRRISFEYALFKGINDSEKQARELAHFLKGLNCHVNLIPANPTLNKSLKPSLDESVNVFFAELERLHIQCTIRQRKGLDIDAGCGQLRSRFYKDHALQK